MKQFTTELAEKFFELIEEADYIGQDENGDVYWYIGEPKKGFDRFSINDCENCGSLGKFKEHSYGWENSLCNRNWKPKLGEKYYSPHPVPYENLFDSLTWEGDKYDLSYQEHGMVFRTSEEAIECAKKMLEAIK